MEEINLQSPRNHPQGPEIQTAKDSKTLLRTTWEWIESYSQKKEMNEE